MTFERARRAALTYESLPGDQYTLLYNSKIYHSPLSSSSLRLIILSAWPRNDTGITYLQVEQAGKEKRFGASSRNFALLITSWAVINKNNSSLADTHLAHSTKRSSLINIYAEAHFMSLHSAHAVDSLNIIIFLVCTKCLCMRNDIHVWEQSKTERICSSPFNKTTKRPCGVQLLLV